MLGSFLRGRAIDETTWQAALIREIVAGEGTQWSGQKRNLPSPGGIGYGGSLLRYPLRRKSFGCTADKLR